MVRKQHCSGALLLCLVLTAPSIFGLEKAVELGRENLWADMMSLQGVAAVPGRWDFKDLALEGGAYALDSATDLLLHFDSPAAADATGGYGFTEDGPVVSDAVSAIGAGSGAFSGRRQGFGLRASPHSMFSAGAAWGDFTIEFWLYPANVSDGETLISWEGSTRAQAAGGGRLLSQGMRCLIRDRKLVWSFQNLFRLPGTGADFVPVQLSGTRQLLPRAWHHHLLRFDSRTGLLEYLLDGLPEAVRHVTDTGRETGSVAVAATGSAYCGPLVLGAGFTGFMDELRISRRFVGDPVLSRFLGKTGAAVSRIIDLGYSATRIARIESVASTPSDSGIEFSYQSADTWGGRKLLKSDTDWVTFVPGTDFKDSLRARYIQVRVEMYPNGARTQSPRLSSLRIVYEPNLPPAPPAGLTATPGNGKVTLTWRKVNDLDVKGYLVFYGTSPHNYLGVGSVQGASPVDAGAATTVEISGLENGSLYYFAVTAYDSSSPRQQSEFSPEISARPSRMYK
jgi:hypothetical protein